MFHYKNLKPELRGGFAWTNRQVGQAHGGVEGLDPQLAVLPVWKYKIYNIIIIYKYS